MGFFGGVFFSSLLMIHFAKKDGVFMAYLQGDSGASWVVCPRRHIFRLPLMWSAEQDALDQRQSQQTAWSSLG